MDFNFEGLLLDQKLMGRGVKINMGPCHLENLSKYVFITKSIINQK